MVLAGGLRTLRIVISSKGFLWFMNSHFSSLATRAYLPPWLPFVVDLVDPKVLQAILVSSIRHRPIQPPITAVPCHRRPRLTPAMCFSAPSNDGQEDRLRSLLEPHPITATA